MNMQYRRQTINGLALSLIALTVLVSTASVTYALSGSVTYRREWMSGAAKMAELRGTYALSAGEKVGSAHIQHLDANFKVVSAARGTMANGFWSVSSGDFRTVYYRAIFYITDVNGGNLRTYYSPTYRWGY